MDRSRDRNTAAALMQRIARRDERALRELFDLHSSLLLAIACRLLRDRHEAEQLLIDVFAEVWQRFDRYDAARGDPLSYLITMTRSRALDRLRSRRGKTSESLRSAAVHQTVEAGPLESALTDERHTMLAGALGNLTSEIRQAVELAFFDGLSHSQIAERLQKPLGTVKTHVRQGIIQLRDLLRTYWKGEREKS